LRHGHQITRAKKGPAKFHAKGNWATKITALSGVTRKFFPEDREKKLFAFIKSVLSTRHIFASKMN
jgi:hypothetical protein